MKRGTIFWGAFLISFGASLLMLRQGWICVDWHWMRDFWAVLLILWGISLLFKNTTYRWIVTAVVAALIGFGLASTVSVCNTSCGKNGNWNFRWFGNDSMVMRDDCGEKCNDDCGDSGCGQHKKQGDSLGTHRDSTQNKQQDSATKPKPIY